MKDFEQRAYDLGQAAFARGVKCAPVLDANVTPLIREMNPAGTVGVKSTVEILDAWLKGWHAANLAA